MTAFLCSALWNWSERTGIPLGRLAPWVLGGMMGRLPRKADRG